MRYSLMILILLLLITGCARQAIYTSKGVNYFGVPAREMETFIKPEVPSITERTGTLYLPGNPLWQDNQLYFPVETSFPVNGISMARSAVYGIDPVTNAVTDSLLLQEAKINQSFRHLVYADSIYIVGIKDTTCHIIKTDAGLKILAEYPTGKVMKSIDYAGIFEGRLRILGSDKNSNLVLYDYLLDTMQPERQRLIGRNYFRSYQDKTTMWFFNDTDDKINVLKLDLAAVDPEAVIKSFNYNILDAYDQRVFTACASGDNIYLGHSLRQDKEGLVSKLVCIDFEKGDVISKEFAGQLAFDVVSANAKTYIFRSVQVNKKDALMITELTSDLQEINPKVTFYLGNLHKVGRIITAGQNKFLLTGNYYQSPNKKFKASAAQLPDGSLFKPFIAVFPAE